MLPLARVPAGTGAVVIRRIGESLQSDTALLTRLRGVGLRPNASVTVTPIDGGVRIGTGRTGVEISDATAAHIFVTVEGDLAAATA
jgi:DtxR family transcriptional regulator, Mn-dependent transcriptional regulator